LAVVLAGVSAARADVVFTAPTTVLPSGTTSFDALLSVSSTTQADTLQAFQLQVVLAKISGSGTASFVGLPATSAAVPTYVPTNYLFGVVGSGGYSTATTGFSLRNATYSNATGAAVDDAGNDVVVLDHAYNLLKLPMAFTGDGVWTITFTSNSSGTDGDFGDVFPIKQTGTITVLGDVVIPAPLAAWGGMALFGLMGLRTWRRRQA